MTDMMFPGGLVRIDQEHIEKRLKEFLGPGRKLVVKHTETGWWARLYIGEDFYSADSELGFWDAVANALQAAYGREEIL